MRAVYIYDYDTFFTEQQEECPGLMDNVEDWYWRKLGQRARVHRGREVDAESTAAEGNKFLDEPDDRIDDLLAMEPDTDDEAELPRAWRQRARR